MVGWPRPDGKAALPALPNEYPGFEIRGFPPGGWSNFRLEAQLPTGAWSEFIADRIKVRIDFTSARMGGGTKVDLLAFQMPPTWPAGPGRFALKFFLAAGFGTCSPERRRPTYNRLHMTRMPDKSGGEYPCNFH